MARKHAFRSLTRQAAPRKNPMPDVTPLVNVALVLLIVFMVVMPIIQEGITVNTPEAVNAAQLVDSSDQHVVLSIKEDGSLFVDLTPVESSQLRTELARAYEGKEEFPIIIKGARNLPYSEILQLVETCQHLGASGVELMAKKADTP
jgi:biopolymer transport protein TolR